MRRHRGISFLAAFDFLAAVVSAIVALLFLALVQQKRYTVPPALRTPGVLAVVASWDGRRDEDVDLYVRGPSGTAYFANPNAGELVLTHDWLGWYSDVNGRHPRLDQERTLLRGVQAGRYAVSVQLYRQGTAGPTPVTVSVYRLIGVDRRLLTVRVVLAGQGSEAPCFQFSVTADARIGGFTRLPIRLAETSWQTGRPS